MPKVLFLPEDIAIETAEGALLLDAARQAGVTIDAPCGGSGVCGKCLVRIESGKVDFPDGLLPADLAQDGYVLACRAKVGSGPVTVQVLTNREKEKGKFTKVTEDIHLVDPALLPKQEDFAPLVQKIELAVAAPEMGDGLSDYDRFYKTITSKLDCRSAEIPLPVIRKLPEALRAEDGAASVLYMKEEDCARVVDIFPASTDFPPVGAAVDIGTTTVAVQLVSLTDGSILGARTDYNAQISCGLDVISRINYAKKPERLLELKEKVLKTINGIIAAIAKENGIDPLAISNISLAGNTTMVQLALGILPEYLRLSPYTPAVYDVPFYRAGELGLNVHPEAFVYFAPSVGSYVGGDITSGLLCTSLCTDSEDLSLFIDLGTNGELVMGNTDFLMGCACSAGPAFEGGGIELGMRASAGAIERVEISPDTGAAEYFVIGGGAPKGICGSGIISLIAELFSKGLLDARGKLSRDKGCACIDASEKNARYIIVPADKGPDGKPVYITELDIDNFIRAKGAIFSACNTMLKKVGMDFGCVSRFYIAGGFGRYLNIENAKTLGLIPDLPQETFRFIGNSSVIGAYCTLVSAKHRALEKEVAAKITYIDLSTEPEYMDEYTAALFLPHTDASLFPKK